MNDSRDLLTKQTLVADRLSEAQQDAPAGLQQALYNSNCWLGWFAVRGESPITGTATINNCGRQPSS